MKIRESARLLEALPDGANGEKIFKVVLITVGLGNRRNMNFYGPEAIESAAKVYEGKFCYINHQDLEEAEILPERDVRDKAGYWKNLKVETIEGEQGCVGELHCDLSESGRLLAEKVQSALHYKKEFPKSDRVYCGFSVNGDGDAEKRDMEIDGVEESVNYVTGFTDDSESCDLVTTPARGGKAVAAIRESETNHKENDVKKNILKLLEAASKSLTESAKKLTGDAKKPFLEASKTLTEAVKAVEAEGEMVSEEAVDALLARREGESEADHTARMKALGDKISGMIGSEEAEDDKPEEKPEEKPEPKQESKRMTAEELERNTLAIKSVISESGLPEGCYSDTKITELAKMPFAEAKKTIEGDAKLAASILRESGVPVASLHRADKTSGGHKAAFIESFKKEI